MTYLQLTKLKINTLGLNLCCCLSDCPPVRPSIREAGVAHEVGGFQYGCLSGGVLCRECVWGSGGGVCWLHYLSTCQSVLGWCGWGVSECECEEIYRWIEYFNLVCIENHNASSSVSNTSSFWLLRLIVSIIVPIMPSKFLSILPYCTLSVASSLLRCPWFM